MLHLFASMAIAAAALIATAAQAQDLSAMVRYRCYQQVWLMLQSCGKLTGDADRQAAYARVEHLVLELMDEEWPNLAIEVVEAPVAAA